MERPAGRRQTGRTKSKLIIHEEGTVKPDASTGSRLKFEG
jgi:hypothetical protein